MQSGYCLGHRGNRLCTSSHRAESSLDFCVRAWTDSFDQAQAIRSELAIEIHDALQAAGIDIPFPQRDVHIRSIEPGIIRPL